MRLCLAYPGNPRFYIEGESPRLCRGHTVCIPTAIVRTPNQHLTRGAPSTHDPTRTWLTTARCNAALARGVLAQRRFLVKKSSASLIVSAWIALRSAPSGSLHCARRNTRPTKVQVPKKTKWPPCGNNFSVACGIALARDSAPDVGGVISSALPLTIATGIETL